jgi:hypothetical protein
MVAMQSPDEGVTQGPVNIGVLKVCVVKGV